VGVLRTYEGRLRLLFRLREAGFLVRMHAYEYIVGDGRRLVAILLLEPWARRADILDLRGSREGVARIANIVREVDPSMEVRVIP